MIRCAIEQVTTVCIENSPIRSNCNATFEKESVLRERCYNDVKCSRDFQAWLDNSYAFGNNSPRISNQEDPFCSANFHINALPTINGKYIPGARPAGLYKSKDEYYDYHNPMRVVKHIVQPCLFVNSEDDPLCLIQNVYESLFLFSATATNNNDNNDDDDNDDDNNNNKNEPIGAIVVVVKTGSHCSFMQGKPWQPWDCTAWSENASSEFFDQILATC